MNEPEKNGEEEDDSEKFVCGLKTGAGADDSFCTLNTREKKSREKTGSVTKKYDSCVKCKWWRIWNKKRKLKKKVVVK